MEGQNEGERSQGKGKVRAVALVTDDGVVGGGEATMVINVWFEAGHALPFRARLTSTTGGAPETVTSYAATREAVLSSVEKWLRNLQKT
ncbi:hypothetical protein LFT45_10525 [Arthrobacter sp. FW305-BF8]|uniref:hypothetical protein n=1 Tax=Arthrobacter sp. FW305-BF8 TaxID=2879617 RepID=UPI001F1CE147|nr:hypothetical protein [Arthrobacter sp. FW305-BF8]UKA56289.1 hypothetical protein LFT45_10525 [Arthrobacter sp. FW305-BF8]